MKAIKVEIPSKKMLIISNSEWEKQVHTCSLCNVKNDIKNIQVLSLKDSRFLICVDCKNELINKLQKEGN